MSSKFVIYIVYIKPHIPILHISMLISEVEIHRRKIQQDEGKQTISGEIASTSNVHDECDVDNRNNNMYLKSEEGVNYEPEQKKLHQRNFGADIMNKELEDHTMEGVPNLKDEEPSSVTSSGCSPPTKPKALTPTNWVKRHMELTKEHLKNSQDASFKLEASSTIVSHNNDVSKCDKAGEAHASIAPPLQSNSMKSYMGGKECFGSRSMYACTCNINVG